MQSFPKKAWALEIWAKKKRKYVDSIVKAGLVSTISTNL